MSAAAGSKLGWAVGGGIIGLLLGLGWAALFWAEPGRSVEGGVEVGYQAGESVRSDSPSHAPGRSHAPSHGNPPRSLGEILEIEGDFAQAAALYQLAVGLGEGRIVELLDEAEAVRPLGDGRAASSILYARYAELNPPAAVDRLLSRGGLHDAASFAPLLGQVFLTWSRADFDGAMARAMQLNMQQRTIAGMAILHARDGLGADQRQTMARKLGLAGILPQLEAQRELSSIQDPSGAWTGALAMPNRRDRDQRLLVLTEVWARKDPQAAMSAVERLERSELRRNLRRLVIRHWANSDVDRALDWALTQPETSDRTSLLTATLVNLAVSDPARALQLTDVLTGPDNRKAVAGVLGAWARADPRAAAQSMLSIQDSATRRQAAGRIAGSFARQYPEEAARWLGQLDPAEADAATVPVVRSLAEYDPVFAGELVAGITDPGRQQRAATQLVNRWARADPEAAVRWTAQLGDAELRSALYRNVLPRWASYDRDAALSYIDGIARVVEREAALTGILRSVEDPALMDRLFQRLTLPNERRRAAAHLFQYWLRVDPDRAAAYQATAGISDAQAAEMSGQSTHLSVLRSGADGLVAPIPGNQAN